MAFEQQLRFLLQCYNGLLSIFIYILSSLLFMERLGCLLRNLNTPMNFKIYISNEFIEIHSLDDKSFEIKLAWRLEFSNPFQDAKSREVLKRSF